MPIIGGGSSSSPVDTSLFLLKAGDTVTGDIYYPPTGYVMEASSGGTPIVPGNPIGLMLAFTYSDNQTNNPKFRVTVDSTGHLTTTPL